MTRFALLLAFCAAAPAAAQSIDTVTLRAHTRFLSSDLLEGRGTGTRGEHIAGLYIASELARLGAKPVAGNDYFVPVPLRRATLDHSATSIAFKNTTYRSGLDFVWNTGGRDAFRDFSGDLLFVGIVDSIAVRRAPETRGKIVIMRGAMGTAAATFIPAIIKAGAAGVILLTGDSTTFDLYARSRGDARYYVDAEVDDPVWQPDIPVVIAGPSLSRGILPSGLPAPFTPINGKLAARIRTVTEDVRSANVAGVIRGTNPALASQYVAYSAHYDHLGISNPDARGDSIYNGFSDNAAGVAMLLAIGEAFRKQRPARSILLLFFTGEERGLLGSAHFAASSPIPLQQIEALINLDAGAPPAPPIEWRIAGGTETPLGATAKAALAARKWQSTVTPATPNSDYWPFLQRRVPAIFIIPGNKWENTTDEQQRQLRARWDRYHQASDEWSADFPFKGLERYAEAALVVGRVVANRK